MVLPAISGVNTPLLTRPELLALLPWGEEALFLHDATSLSQSSRDDPFRVSANVLVCPDYCRGHFPGMPVFKACDMIEVAFQTAAAGLAMRGTRDRVGGFATEILHARFLRPVFPGQTLTVTVGIGKELNHVIRFAANGSVDDSAVFESQQCFIMLNARQMDIWIRRFRRGRSD